jgi:hypothetical protein
MIVRVANGDTICTNQEKPNHKFIDSNAKNINVKYVSHYDVKNDMVMIVYQY